MVTRIWTIALACTLLPGCATLPPAPEAGPGTVPDAPIMASPQEIEEASMERFRFVDEEDRGLTSVLLVPTAVEGFVAVGPMARSRIFLGALFATQRVGGDRVAGVGLVIKAVGGGLGPALSAAPFVALTVDGERKLLRSVARDGLYSIEPGPWGTEETLTFRVSPDIVRAMAQGGEVTMQVGDRVMFSVEDGHRVDLADFLDQIPEGTRFAAHPEVGPIGAWKTD